MTRDNVINFYNSTDYNSEIRKGNPYRPKEWHLPHFIFQLEKKDPMFLIEIQKEIIRNRAEINLDTESCLNLRATLLHEALFNLYKGFYNYLAAKRLYGGGVLPWIEITGYYSKLYLARSVNTLLGKQSYRVDGNKPYFSEKMLQMFNPKGFAKLSANRRVAYSIEIDLDIK